MYHMVQFMQGVHERCVLERSECASSVGIKHCEETRPQLARKVGTNPMAAREEPEFLETPAGMEACKL